MIFQRYPAINNFLGLASISLLACNLVLDVRPVAAAPAAPAVVAAPAVNLLAAPELSPQIVGANGTFTIMAPPNFPLSTSRLQVGLFEAGRPAHVTDIQRDFSVVNGRLQATVNIQANPGAYEVRLVSGDKAHTPISLPASLLVPGVDRSPGWWLFNGSPFVPVVSLDLNHAVAGGPIPINEPLFVPGLKRDLSNKPRPVTGNINTFPNGLLRWKTLPLPPLTELVAPGYDFAALRSTLQRQLAEAQGRGERDFLGFELTAGVNIPEAGSDPNTLTGPEVATAIGNLRQILNTLNPDAALILRANGGTPDERQHAIALGAALCDAVVIDADSSSVSLWPVKEARRTAEEQPNYDLPIFVNMSQFPAGKLPEMVDRSRVALNYLMAGATGVIGMHPGIGGDVQSSGGLDALFKRNAPLFIGAVTLEDIGLLPTPETDDPTYNATQLYSALRTAHRIPLVARLNSTVKGDSGSETFAVSLGDRVSSATIEGLRKVASTGARIYIEGTPLLDETGKYAGWRMGSLAGGTVKPVDEKNPQGKRTAMTLTDGWMFGTGRGTEVDVRQTVVVTLNKDTVAGQAKQRKGMDVLTAPRVAATLADGTPALIINPVGKGEVVWMPHHPVRDPELMAALRINNSLYHTVADSTSATSASPGTGITPLNIDRSSPITRYYTAVSSYLQPPLVQVRGTDARAVGAEAVRVALRRTAKGSYLVTLFNSGSQPAVVAASVDGVAGVALDLANEKELPLTVSGNSSEAKVTVPANGWSLIAFSQSRRALDEERNAPRLKATLR